jgi:hypothetical protein
MLRSIAPAIIWLIVLTSPCAHAADACSLLGRAEAATLLGQPVTSMDPAGPQRDEDSGGQLTFCTYRAGNAAVVVSVVEYSSAADAKKQLNANLVKERMDSDEAKVSEEPGIGEKSYWGASANGASYVFLKKSKVAGIAVGGSGAAKLAVSKEALRSAALAVAAKL